jgi:hypothetical protein
MGVFREYSKGDDMNGRQFFVTPSYQIGNQTTIGIGAGLKLFKYYKEDSFISAFPLYVNSMYKFKSNGITPFVEGKLGYTFLKDSKSGKIGSPFPWAPVYPTGLDPETEFRTETKGGFFFSPSFGFLFPVKNQQYFSASLAYGLDSTFSQTELIQTNERLEGSIRHHSLALRIGYIF